MSSTSLFVRLQGLYQTLQIDVCIDSRSEKSYISSEFVIAHRIAQTVRTMRGQLVARTVRGPVIVPTVNGYYESTFELVVGAVKGCDVLLGQDWIIGSVCHVRDGCILDPPVGSVLVTGHRWGNILPGKPYCDHSIS